MNKSQIFDMTALLDDKYILEADGVKGRSIKMKKRFIGIMAAAAIAVTGIVGAGAAIYNGVHKESVSQFYNESGLEMLESGGYTLGSTAENEHMSITLDSFTYDDHCGLSVITVDALDEKARDYLVANKGYFNGIIYYTDTDEDAFSPDHGIGFTGFNGYENGKQLVLQAEILFNSGAYVNIDISRPLGIRFSAAKTQWVTDPDESIFEGMRFELPMDNKVKSTTLYSDDGEELYLSEISFVTMADPLTVSDPMYQIHWNDGTEFDENLCLTLGLSGGGLFLNGENKGYITYFRELVDIDKVDSLTFNGTEYKRR